MKMLIGRVCFYCRAYFLNDRWDGVYWCPKCRSQRLGLEIAPRRAAAHIDLYSSQKIGTL